MKELICDIVIVVVLVSLISFLVTAVIYLKTGAFKRFYHDVLEWHSPADEMGFDGCSFTNVCKYCGKKIMQDSQGNWF